MPKKQNPHTSPKIPPALPPQPSKSIAGQKPTKVLAKFNVPYNVRKIGGKGPFIQGYECMATWDVIIDDDRLLEFMELEDKIGNVHTLYHGTPTRNIADIVSEGLHPGHQGCMFGSGVYLAHPPKAILYARDRGFRKSMPDNPVFYMLKVRVVLGKVKDCNTSEKWSLKKLQEIGCHSVAGFAGITMGRFGALRGSEWVVYSPSQVLVEKIYEYQPTEEYVDNYKYTPSTSGTCGLMYPSKKAIDPQMKGMSAFKDLVAKEPCSKTAHRQLQIHNGSVWVCNECIEKHRLKIGSHIEVADPRHWSGRGPPIKARIEAIKK